MTPTERNELLRESSTYEVICDGCENVMLGNTNSVIPPYAVDAVTFTKHEYYCSDCWARMKRALRK